MGSMPSFERPRGGRGAEGRPSPQGSRRHHAAACAQPERAAAEGKKYPRQDSNLQPLAPEANALSIELRGRMTRWTTRNRGRPSLGQARNRSEPPGRRRGMAFQAATSGLEWSRRDSNPRPSHCERDALPAELRPLHAADSKGIRQRGKVDRREWGRAAGRLVCGGKCRSLGIGHWALETGDLAIATREGCATGSASAIHGTTPNSLLALAEPVAHSLLQPSSPSTRQCQSAGSP